VIFDFFYLPLASRNGVFQWRKTMIYNVTGVLKLIYMCDA